MKQQLLLLEDVNGLGRSGDVVTAKPGFIRNFLLPQKKAVSADKHTLKMQTRLKEEREKRAAVDRKEAEAQAEQIKALVLSIEVKIDPDGKMYGSVSTLDIARLLQAKGYQIDRKSVQLNQAIKTLGSHSVGLRLKEGVPATFTLDVQPEAGLLLHKKPAAQEEPQPQEADQS